MQNETPPTIPVRLSSVATLAPWDNATLLVVGALVYLVSSFTRLSTHDSSKSVALPY